MKERARAKFYQEHKNDPDVIGDAQPQDEPRLRGSYSATITVRFSQEEADIIRRMSEERQASYSDILREAIKEYAAICRPMNGRTFVENYHPLPFVEVASPKVDLDPAFAKERGKATYSIAQAS